MTATQRALVTASRTLDRALNVLRDTDADLSPAAHESALLAVFKANRTLTLLQRVADSIESVESAS